MKPSESSLCGVDSHCSAILYKFYGMTIPNLALASFIIIFILSLIILYTKGEKYDVTSL